MFSETESMMSTPEEDNEVGLSRSALNKLIKDTIPHVRVANESRELLHNCCVEFIKYVGAESNRLCAEEQKKTIAQEHVFKGKDSGVARVGWGTLSLS